MGRRFTQNERTELFLLADGLCMLCGAVLNPENFHADHKHPWSEGGITDIDNGQALCPACSLKKGASMLLSHQEQFRQACLDLKADSALKTVLAHVICGGGKSAYGPIAVHELVPYRGDAFCWVAPRATLRSQAEDVFQEPWLRNLLGHNNEIRKAVNEVNPVRDTKGYCTTYQAVVEAAKLRKNPHLEMFQRKRMIMMLDEIATVERGGVTHAALQPLMKLASVLIFTGGHLTRHDNKYVAGVGYLPKDQSGKIHVLCDNTATQRFIRYNLSNATRDHQLIKIDFELRDSSAKWFIEDDVGNEYDDKIDSFDNATKQQTSRAIMTALSTEFFEQLLDEGVKFWLERRRANPRSKLLIVCARISHADKCVKILHQMGITDYDIATSEDSDAAEEVLLRFRGKKKPELFACSTVGMAYIGMDCPAADVLVCLTHIRSREWIEQMLHRISRYDRNNPLPWEQQFATVFAPKDKFFLSIMAEIKADQAPYVTEFDRSPGPPPPPKSRMYPRSSDIGDPSTHTLDEKPIEAADHDMVTTVLKEADAVGAISNSQAYNIIMRGREYTKSTPGNSGSQRSNSQQSGTPPSQREAQLRNDIVKYQRRGYAGKDNPAAHAKTAERIRQRGHDMAKMFGPLENLTESQLKAVWAARTIWGNP
jgi:hypothetical protein